MLIDIVNEHGLLIMEIDFLKDECIGSITLICKDYATIPSLRDPSLPF